MILQVIVKIYLNNVRFINLEGRTTYGIIYIEDDFEVYFDNCIFENNTNFIH